MPSFVDRMVAQYSSSDNAEDVVRQFMLFYKQKEDEAKEKGRERKISFLGNVQSNLSRYKMRVKAPPEFKKKLHITKEELAQVASERHNSMRKQSIDIVAINGDKFVADCQDLLIHPDFCLKVIALACLTGRRMTEIVSTVKLDEAKEKHFTNSIYWACAKGLLKQRGEDKCVDIPLLAPRSSINACLRALREQCGHIAAKDVNRLVSKKISRAMKKYCPEIGNIHAFRKLYVLMCFHYFNERNCSLPRLASDYLGHKSMSESVLTYLNFRVENIGSLNFK